jgi:hypothetical protein
MRVIDIANAVSLLEVLVSGFQRIYLVPYSTNSRFPGSRRCFCKCCHGVPIRRFTPRIAP